MINFSSSLKILLSKIVKDKDNSSDVIKDFFETSKFIYDDYSYVYLNSFDNAINHLNSIEGNYLAVLYLSNYVGVPKIALVLKYNSIYYYLVVISDKIQASEVVNNKDLAKVLTVLTDKYFSRKVVTEQGLHIDTYTFKGELRESKIILKDAYTIHKDGTKEAIEGTTEGQASTEQTSEEQEQLKTEYSNLMNSRISLSIHDLCSSFADKGFRPNIVFDYTKKETFTYLPELTKRFKLDSGYWKGAYPLLIVEFICDKKFLDVIKMYPFLIIGVSLGERRHQGSSSPEMRSSIYYTPALKIVLPQFKDVLDFVKKRMSQEVFQSDSDKYVVQTNNTIKEQSLLKFVKIMDELDTTYNTNTNIGYQNFIKKIMEDKNEYSKVKNLIASEYRTDRFMVDLVNKRLQAFGLSSIVKIDVIDRALPFSFLNLYQYFNTLTSQKDTTPGKDILDSFIEELEIYDKAWFYELFNTLLKDTNFQRYIIFIQKTFEKTYSDLWGRIFKVLSSKSTEKEKIEPLIKKLFSMQDKDAFLVEFKAFLDKLGITPQIGTRTTKQTIKQKVEEPTDYFKGYTEINNFINKVLPIKKNLSYGQRLIDAFKTLSKEQLDNYEKEFALHKDYMDDVVDTLSRDTKEQLAIMTIEAIIKSGKPFKGEINKEKETGKPPTHTLVDLFDASKPNPHITFLQTVLGQLEQEEVR